MNASASPLSGLFDDAKARFEKLRAELAIYGLVVPPSVELREGQGLLCYYDLQDGNIHLSLPDPSHPLGVFQAAIFRSLLRCADDAELASLIRLILPMLLAHELGHYFRHRSGRFGADLWFEEQVANQFAAAVIEHRFPPKERDELTRFMHRTLDHLASEVDSKHIATESYLDPLQALGASGLLGQQTVRILELFQGLFSVSPEQILRAAPRIPTEVLERLAQRQETIDGFNDTYTSGLARYVYFQFGWMLIELETPEQHYVDEVAQQHFGLDRPLLPLIAHSQTPTEEEIFTAFRAYKHLAPTSLAASRYFFKRYRSLLLDRIAQATETKGGNRKRLDVDVRRFLESQDAEDPRTLDFLATLVDADERALFPVALAERPPRSVGLSIANALQCETDARLYRHVVEGGADPAAAATLARIEQLDASEVFRALPAELLIRLTHLLCRVRVPAGETLIWKGSMNDDVFMLVSGELEVLVDPDERRIGTVSRGEMVGDMAFLTGEPRSATLRATKDTECLVLRSVSLKLLAYEHPELMTRFARVIAKRLSALIASPARSGQNEEPKDATTKDLIAGSHKRLS